MTMMATIRTVALLALAAAGLSSCAYDPYGADYSASYGYAGGGGTTFVHTSSSRWLYDPTVRCYYDVQRSLYYDPFLYGYYPSGYCPRPIYHAPHPYGWSGRGACPTPREVRFRQLQNYRDRQALLRQRNYQWAQNVRVRQDSAVSGWQRQQVQRAANFQRQQNRAPQGRPQFDSRNNDARQAPNLWNQRAAARQQAVRQQPQAAPSQRSRWQQQQQQAAQNQRSTWQQQARREQADRTRPAPRIHSRPEPPQRQAPQAQPQQQQNNRRGQAMENYQRLQQQQQQRPRRPSGPW